MKKLETIYAGLTLRNPIVVSSSGLTSTAEKCLLWENAGVGAVVLKSLFEEQIDTHIDQLDAEAYPEAREYLQQYVSAHELGDYLALINEAKEKCTIPIIASINCYRKRSWSSYAKRVEAAGADAIELNIFKLCTDLNGRQDELEKLYIDVVKQVRKHIKIPIIVKCAKYFSNLPAIVNRLHKAGANGVVLFNRFYQADIDIETMQPSSGQLYNHSAEINDTLRWCNFVSSRIPQSSLAASTGVISWEDVLKCILAGANAVYICSLFYREGHPAVKMINDKLISWVERYGIEQLSEVTGRAHLTGESDSTLFERVQFIKYMSSK